MKRVYPFLISIPHGGSIVPREVKDIINLSYKDVFFDGDPCTQNIYDFKENVEGFIKMPISRAIVDVNRAPDDFPPKNPDGVVKSLTINGTPVYKKDTFPDDSTIEKLLKKYYFPYHEGIDVLLETKKIKLAFDCHSMLPISPNSKDKLNSIRPLICLSNGGNKNGKTSSKKRKITCSPEWIQGLSDSFRKEFECEIGDVLINDPFLGGYISQFHYAKRRIPFIQIEINRKLYFKKSYFDEENLMVKQERILELKGKIFNAILQFYEDYITPTSCNRNDI